jgi:hypothetical protein
MRDRGFESCFLQRGVNCEPDFIGAHELGDVPIDVEIGGQALLTLSQ